MKQIIKLTIKILKKIYHLASFNNLKKKSSKNESLIIKWDGQKFYGNPSLEAIPNKIFHNQAWEPEATEIFIKNLKPGMTVIDIGAQFGYYTLLAAKRVGKTGQILAFEPKSWIRHFLFVNKHINFYDNIKIYPYGLFSHTTKGIIDDMKSRVDLKTTPDSQTKDIPKINLNDGGPKKQRNNVPEVIRLVTLDNIINLPCKTCEDKDIQIKSVDLIKIDIEGAELDAMLGMKNIINRFHPKILVEIHPPGLSYFGHSCADFFNLLNSLNYKYQLVDCSPEDIKKAIEGKKESNFHLLYYYNKKKK
jgi:FkbM family methyltransferase